MTDLKSATMTFSTNSNTNFGILEVVAQPVDKPLIKDLKIYLNIDISGSMSEHCKDGKEKIEHIRTIIQNLLRELYEFKEQKIAIIVNGFESTVHKIMNIDNLLEQDLATNVIPKINQLVPLNSTNIEKALKEAKETLDLALNEDLDVNVNQVVHIMLTDGNATEGSTNPDTLKTFMPTSCKNILLGIGNDYDATALKTMSSCPLTIFKHINEAETAGLCVGELIHSLLFEVINNLKITIKNGEIYDYNKGVWTQTLHVDGIASEQKKVYHIRRQEQTPVEEQEQEQTVVNLEWMANKTQHHCIIDTNTTNDLTQYKFRQNVLELLHSASQIINNIQNGTNVLYDHMFGNAQDIFVPYEEHYRQYYEKKQKEKKESEQNIIDIKRQLKSLLIEILKYMDDNNLQDDMFYIILCKDLKVTIDSIDKENAELYISARLTSQGSQETYSYNPDDSENDNINDNINDNEEDELVNKLLTSFNHKNNNNNNNKKINNMLKSPYTTPRQAKLMRDISSTNQTLSDNSD
jgi:hypothetical protein